MKILKEKLFKQIDKLYKEDTIERHAHNFFVSLFDFENDMWEDTV